MDIKPPSTKNSGNSNKKKLILEAARKAYATHGLTHATVRQISDIAGIGKSTIFEYFQSKEELQDAVFHFLISGMAEGHMKLHELAERDPVLALNQYIDSAIQTALNEPTTLLLISQYSLGILLKTDNFEAAKEQYSQRMYSVMQELTDEFRFILTKGIALNLIHPSVDIPMEGLIYTIGALIREIQAQAFLNSEKELSHVCNVIKDTILKLLGVAEIAKPQEE